MTTLIKRALDAWRGAGPSSVTVPPMDGALRPNQAIEEAPVLLHVTAPDNLVKNGSGLFFSSGADVRRLRVGAGAAQTESFARFESAVTSLDLHPDGGIAAGLEDGRIVFRGGRHNGRVLTELSDRAIICPAALLFADESTLLVALGSQQNPPGAWKHDLMQRNASGSVWRVDLDGGGATCLADHLAYPYGLLPTRDGGVLVSESWRSQLLRLRPGKKPEVALGDISGYPARLAPADDGTGFWLSVFAPRSQLVEFVIRERDYCADMMREIDPQFWIAPSLSATQSFLEPMQVGGLKQLGMLKPWAPSRSYGLVVRLDNDCEPQASFHSRADGKRHGTTSCVETDGTLVVASKGGDVVVSIPLVAGV